MKCYMCNKELTTGDCGTKGLCNECINKSYYSPVKNLGWECPKCGRVYAPFIGECNNCNQVKIYTNSTTTAYNCKHDSTTTGIASCVSED